MENLTLIACISQDYGLGYQGDLLWHIPADMQFFRQATQHSVVVMGRKTFESIGRPLPNRQNIVLSRHPIEGKDIIWCKDEQELEEHLAGQDKPVFIIGGAAIYSMFIDKAKRLLLTEVASTKPADTFFPEFDKGKFDRQVLQTGNYDDIDYEIVEYVRKS